MELNGQTRRLTAILAADVVGYSRLMGEDEDGTLAALRAAFAEVIRPALDAHSGRLVKLMGDGALAEFASVVDAVRCAVAIQADMAARAGDGLRLRIGVNLGDIIHEDGDIFGDGVNVAARLEGIAEPGGICVSRTVADQVGAKAGVAFQSMGAQTLKNIAEPVEAFRVVFDGAPEALSRAPPRRRRVLAAVLASVLLLLAAGALWRIVDGEADFDQAKALALPTGPTIAVLPFRNLSGDAAQGYLADGITDDLILELGRYGDLNILSRQSTLAYRDSAADIRAIGRDLDAAYVLEGAARRAGDRLRVTARLADSATGAQVWAEAYDAELTASNLFDVQIGITQRVADAVGSAGGAISAIDLRRARTKPPERLSSYECTLYHPNFFYDRPYQDRIAACVERVVQTEPDYWRGWAQLADSLRIDVLWFSKKFPGAHAEKLARAVEAGRRATALNPDAPRAHYSLASALLLQGDREGFLHAAERALSLGGDRRMEASLGNYLVWSGYRELGEEVVRRAMDLDPKSTDKEMYRSLARARYMAGDYEQALDLIRKGREDQYWWHWTVEIAALVRLGRMEEARAARDRLYAARPGVKIADIVWVYRRFQRPDAISLEFVEALREAGIPEGTYRPLDPNDTG